MPAESFPNSTFKDILDHLMEGCQIVGHDWRFLYANEVAARQARKALDELPGQKITDVYPGLDETPTFQTLTQCMTARTSATLTGEFPYSEGDTAWLELRVQPIPEGLLVMSVDITGRKSAQAALQVSETRYRRLFETAQDGILILDAETGQITDVNPFLEKMLGHSHTELLGRRLWEIGPFKDIAATQAAFLELQRSGYIRYEDLPLEASDGRRLNVEFVSNVYLVDRRRVIQCNIRDITARKHSEKALGRLSRALKVLSECNQVLVHVDDEQRLLAEICRLIVETGGYRMAWVGLAEQDPARSIRPIAQCGFDDGYLERAQITWADTERGRGPTGTAVRTGVVQVNQNFLINPAMAPWREAARARGFQSSVALPLKNAVSTFGALTIYSSQPDAFDAGEADLLIELANDLSYGINALHARAAHQRAEQALQDSENRYRRITESLTDYQYAVRVENGRPVETTQSPTCATVTGYTAEEFAADPYLWIRMVPPEDRELVQERVQQVLAGNEIPPIEHRICRKDGETRWVSDTTILFKDAAGHLLSYDGVIKDITDRKRAEEALRESEQRFRLLFQNLTSGFALHEIIVDEQGKPCDYRFLDINPAFETLTGLRAQDIIGKTVRQVLPNTEAVWIERYGQVALTGTPIQFENFSGALGKYYEVSAYCPEHGQFAVTFSDITGRKRAEDALHQSEERFRSVYENSTVGIYRTTPDGRILMANPALVEILGYASFDELAARDLEKNGFEPAYSRAQFIEVVERAGEVKGLESAWTRRDGTAIFIRESARAIRGPDGQVLYYDGIVEDISERKWAEEALRESEDKFRYVFDYSVVGKSITQPNGKIQVNKAFCEMLGYSSEELQNKNWHDITHPDDIDLTQREINSLLSGEKEAVRFIKRFLQKNGSVVWIDMSSSLRRDKAGQPLYFVTTLVDITERQQAAEALRASEERFRALIENSADVIALLTGEGIILYESPAVRRVLGYQPAEMVGHNGFEYLHPGDYAPGQELFGRLFQPHPEPVTTELRYKCKDDTWAWVQATGTNLLAEPSVKAVVINYHDITDRKRADQELRARNRELSVLYAISSHATQSLNFEQALDATLATTLAALDVDAGGIYLWEPGVSVLTLQAYHGPDELRHMVDRIHPGQSLPGRMVSVQEPVVMNIDDFPADRIPAHVLQTGFRSMVTVPLMSGGVLLGALIVGARRDHAFPPADLKMLAAIGRQLGGDLQANRTRELAAANDRLQELDRLKSKFVSDVSHELRTPITALSLNVDLLERGKPEKREQYLQAIRQQVKRQVQLLEDILNLSRLELGADKVQFSPVALNALIAQVVAVHQPAADARSLTLTYAPQSDLPVVQGEENQLAQVITNLIGNAINYTPAGEIRVSTGLKDHNVLIEVRDTGLGIAPEDMSHLFERFYRGRRTRDIRGTGLGLAIVKEIVDLHDGRIEVDSEAGGTTFRVYLPLTTRPSAVGETNEPA